MVTSPPLQTMQQTAKGEPTSLNFFFVFFSPVAIVPPFRSFCGGPSFVDLNGLRFPPPFLQASSSGSGSGSFVRSFRVHWSIGFRHRRRRLG